MSRLAELLLLAVAGGLAAVLMTAMAFQYAGGEIPSPLCLLERVAMFGTAFAALAARSGASRPLGHALLWTLALLVIAARQTLLDIVPRPGHAYPGSAILGLHMPVWAVVIALALILALAAVLGLRGDDGGAPRYDNAARALGWVLLGLAGVNLVSALMQCGFGACHTWGYVALG